jgi:hypothetical protein
VDAATKLAGGFFGRGGAGGLMRAAKERKEMLAI